MTTGYCKTITQIGRLVYHDGEPEWFVSGDNKVVSKPISQTMGTPITAEATLNLLPATAAAAPITLRSESLDPYLQFRFSGTMQGGTGQIISLSSVGKLPAQVTSLRDRRVRWHMKWHDSDHEIGLTKHTIFVTMGTPFEHEDGAITHKRMAKAVEIIGNIRPRTLDPHEIAEGIMRNWNQYSLEIPLHKPIWTFADTVAAGGQCVDIVRFVRAIIQMVGCPGTREAVVIWADPTAPSVPQENNSGAGEDTAICRSSCSPWHSLESNFA